MSKKLNCFCLPFLRGWSLQRTNQVERQQNKDTKDKPSPEL